MAPGVNDRAALADGAPRARRLWAPQAWIGARWRERVLLEIDDGGCWLEIACGVDAPADALRLAGPVLAGLVDAHGHAFQRAGAGRAESRIGEGDDFWSWREQMYRVAAAIGPEELRAVAAHLYAELLAGGYTQVCEFHYLHRTRAGRDERPQAMAEALAAAAADAGIGLTWLPALYERAGFTEPALAPAQARFATTPGEVLALAEALPRGPLVERGVALHSLRAVTPVSLARLVERAGPGPIHIHVAEQRAEVDACIAATGLRPLEWLAAHAGLDSRWQLVHATHALPHEIDAVAAAGAGVVLCPTTEANLGDGCCDLPRWLAAGVPLAVGSDSQVGRAWPEELRWLEYGQRLALGRRNVAAAPPAFASTAARLYERVLAGGGRAAGHRRWGLERGARADLLVVDLDEPAFAGVARDGWLDALVFAAPARPFAATLVGGRWTAPDRPRLAARYAAALERIDSGAAPSPTRCRDPVRYV